MRRAACRTGLWLERTTKSHEFPGKTAASLDHHESFALGSLVERSWSMQEHAEGSPHEAKTSVHDVHHRPYEKTIARTAQQKHPPRQAGCRASQPDAVRGAAHDAVQHDDLGGRHL